MLPGRILMLVSGIGLIVVGVPFALQALFLPLIAHHLEISWVEVLLAVIFFAASLPTGVLAVIHRNSYCYTTTKRMLALGCIYFVIALVINLVEIDIGFMIMTMSMPLLLLLGIFMNYNFLRKSFVVKKDGNNDAA